MLGCPTRGGFSFEARHATFDHFTPHAEATPDEVAELVSGHVTPEDILLALFEPAEARSESLTRPTSRVKCAET